MGVVVGSGVRRDGAAASVDRRAQYWEFVAAGGTDGAHQAALAADVRSARECSDAVAECQLNICGWRQEGCADIIFAEVVTGLRISAWTIENVRRAAHVRKYVKTVF